MKYAVLILLIPIAFGLMCLWREKPWMNVMTQTKRGKKWQIRT